MKDVFKKAHPGRLSLQKPEAQHVVPCKWSNPAHFLSPQKPALFLRFRPRLKTTQACVLWKKIMGQSEGNTHLGKTQIPLD